MALKLEANYSKKIGLPKFSSHQFSVTLTTEITDLNKVQAESDRLYSLLQTSVDRSIQSVGYLPEALQQNGNGQSNGNGHAHSPKPSSRINTPVHDWKCSVSQKELILDLIEQNKLDKTTIEDLAVKRFGKGVKALNKLEASGLISELLEQYPKQPRSR